jgi:hypothetical protein
VATDGDLLGQRGTDKLRIRIIDSSNGDSVYDNKWGSLITDDPVTVVSGGGIIIHKAK